MECDLFLLNPNNDVPSNTIAGVLLLFECYKIVG